LLVIFKFPDAVHDAYVMYIIYCMPRLHVLAIWQVTGTLINEHDRLCAFIVHDHVKINFNELSSFFLLLLFSFLK